MSWHMRNHSDWCICGPARLTYISLKTGPTRPEDYLGIRSLTVITCEGGPGSSHVMDETDIDR